MYKAYKILYFSSEPLVSIAPFPPPFRPYPVLCFEWNFIFFWPHRVAYGISVPWPGTEPVPPVVETQSREFCPPNQFLNVFLLFINFNIPSFYLFKIYISCCWIYFYLFHPIFVFIFKHSKELSRCLADVSLFNPPNNHVGWELLLSPLFKWVKDAQRG